MAWAMVAIAAASTAYTLYSKHEEGKEVESAAEEKSRLLEMQAQEVLERGVINRELYARQGKATIGAQQAALAAMGVDTSTGSALLMQEYSAAAIGEELINMSREAEYEAMAVRNESLAARAAGQDAKDASKMQSYGALISGAGQAYQGYNQ